MPITPTADQLRVIEAARVIGVSIVLSAPAGTGKGVVLDHIVREKTEDGVGHLSLAYSGVAAKSGPCGWLNGVAIPATTVHQKLTQAARYHIWAIIKKLRFHAFSISIDEFAMCPAEVFYDLVQVVQEHLPSRGVFRVAYYLMGDVYQIESIGLGLLQGDLFWKWIACNACASQTAGERHTCHAVVRGRPQVHRLTELLRFDADDHYYRGLYAELYHARPNAGRLACMLQERVLRPPPPSNRCRWLTKTNAVRHKINTRWWYDGYISLRRTVLQLHGLGDEELAESLRTAELTSIPVMPEVCTFVTATGEAIPGGQLAIGMEMVCEKNEPNKRVPGEYERVNGQRFILKAFGGTAEPESSKRKRDTQLLGKRFLADRHAWLSASPVGKRKEQRFEAPFYPNPKVPGGFLSLLTAGAATTIAKAQGSTLGADMQVVVDPKSCDNWGELLTMLTRGTQAKNLYVLAFPLEHLERLLLRPMHARSKKFIALHE